ncbi:unnamed protein product [Ectocarpus sp. 12 AP-2014]
MEGGQSAGEDGAGGGQDIVRQLRARVAELEEENDLLAVAATHEPRLLADVKRLTLRVVELEEENETLSDANLRLSQAQGRGHGNEGGDNNNNDNGEESHHVDGVGVADDPAAPFVVPGDSTACLRWVSDNLVGCHGGTNVLCARACPSLPGIVASGGADMSLQVSRLAQGLSDDEVNVDSGGSTSSSSRSTELHRFKLAAPVLSMDFCPSSAPFCGGGGGGGGSAGLLLAGGMDGSSHLVSVDGRHGCDAGDGSDGDDCEETNGVALLASMKNHAKYVVVCRWAPDGRAFVTASHDKVVTLYTLRGGGDGTGKGGVGGTGFEQATQLYFPEAVESVEFVRGEGGALELVVSARAQPHLTYVNIETLQQRRVSLNEKEWDTHVSFTVMSMAASGDGKYLLAATDKSRNILWRSGSNARVRTLMGHTTDDYFQPRVQWDPSGLFSYCNSSGDHDVHVHCLASGRVVEQLKGHRAVIRDIHHDPSRSVLVTASYDKTVKVWGER